MIEIAAVSVVGVAVVSMVVLGIAFGVGLAIAARTFHVDVNPRVEQVLEVLPQINCGACGYKNCEDYAQAVALHDEAPNLCVPGGMDAADKIARIMGIEAVHREPVVSFLHCQGGADKCGSRCEYDGAPSCRAAVVAHNGPKSCIYGCLGFGDCVPVCPVDAITMGPDRLPIVDQEICIGCGLCVKVCPRNLYSLLPKSGTDVWLGCSSQGKGKAVKDICSVGCIACTKCVKVDPKGAIVMKGNLPELDYSKGSTFLEAAQACPMHCFVVRGRKDAPAAAEEAAAT